MIRPEVASKLNEEDFFELLTRSQSKRMDDQRCSLKILAKEQKDVPRKPLAPQNVNSNPIAPKENRNALLEMIADLQSERMDEQRASLPGLIGRGANQNIDILKRTGESNNDTDEKFIDMLMRCQVS